ncbi:MAG: hypothetical protein IPH68_03715 [Chitinophagaceae bacterium]|nr:hypothetical protein [Chitinophagaceae bacterium]
MNYLAHAYLSFNDPEILLGNMISDYIKGKNSLIIPYPFRKGSGFTGSLTSLPIHMRQPTN